MVFTLHFIYLLIDLKSKGTEVEVVQFDARSLELNLSVTRVIGIEIDESSTAASQDRH